MQVATIEFARNVCGIAAANSSEFDQESAEPVICLLDEQRKIRKKGGSMRLGTWPTKIVRGTLAEKIYGHDEVLERHRHRYEFNMKYREQMEEKGFLISGTSPDGALAELIELRGSPVFPRLPVSPGIPKQTEQAAPAVQRISFAPASPTRVRIANSFGGKALRGFLDRRSEQPLPNDTAARHRQRGAPRLTNALRHARLAAVGP